MVAEHRGRQRLSPASAGLLNLWPILGVMPPTSHRCPFHFGLLPFATASLVFALGCGDDPGAGAADASPAATDGAEGLDGGVGGSELLPPSQAPLMSYCPFTDATNLTSFEGRPVIRVCHVGDNRDGCDVDSIATAIDSANNGDRIEIVNDGTPYTECAVIPDTLSGVEIIGVCGRPHLKDVVCQKKGLFLNLGRDITITNVEVSNLAISEADGANAAAVRDQSLGNLNLRYVYFHDNQNGVLGGKGIVNMDWSKFEGNGSPLDPGFTHNIYMSADVDELNIRNSLFLRAQSEGNNLKTRAQSMNFHCSVSASLDGQDSREMDISEGGAVSITNSIIEQGPPSVNSGMVGFATESGNADRRHDVMTLEIRDTDFINDRGNGTFLQYNAYNGFTLSLERVRMIGPGTAMTNSNGGQESVTETAVEKLADRSAASMPAYSDDHMLLPKPPGCPNFEYF